MLLFRIIVISAAIACVAGMLWFMHSAAYNPAFAL